MRAAENIHDASAINVGTAEHIKIIESAEMIIKQIGYTQASVNIDTSKPVGVFSRAADLSPTRKKLNWEPRTSFEDGLLRTIKWYYQAKAPGQVASRLGILLVER
jgi:nucleoside-diphosphate-sugar epimerase